MAPRFLRTLSICSLFFLQFSFFAYSNDNISPLTYRVLDAEFSKQLNRIIMISENPSQLHIYDPVAKADAGTVDLPQTPTCISVSPDGKHAAVGHNGWISYIDLTTASLEKVLSTTTDVFDVVLAGNGFVYAFPRVDQWENIRCVNIYTGQETLSTGGSLYAGTRGRLHPNGKSIYAADNGLSPSDIEKYDISNGTAQFLYDSPYHGDYPMCGDVWPSEDGLRLFTKCGRVFRSSDVRTEDMTYNGALSELSRVQSISHMQDNIAVIPATPYSGGGNDTEIQFYKYSYLAFQTKANLPSFKVNDKFYPAHGRFVFFSPDGGTCYIVVMADPTAGLLYDYGVVSYSVPSGVRKTPAFTIRMSKYTYVDGDAVRVDEFRISNQTEAPAKVEIGVWLRIPGMEPWPVYNLGADGSFQIPSGSDFNYGPFDLFQTTSELPRGTYEFSVRMVDPVTKNLINQDLNNFVIQ